MYVCMYYLIRLDPFHKSHMYRMVWNFSVHKLFPLLVDCFPRKFSYIRGVWNATFWKPDFKPKLVCDFLSDLYPILDLNYEEAVSTVWLALFDVPTYVLYSYTIIMPKTTLPVDPCSFSCSGSLFPVNTLKGRFNSGHWLFVLTIYLMEIPCDGSTFFFRFPNRLSSVS